MTKESVNTVMSSQYITGTLSGKVLDELRSKAGLHPPLKPNGVTPVLPEDVTDLSDEDLMILFADFTAWADYGSSQLAVCVVEEREQQRMLDLKKAQRISKGSKGSVSEIKAHAEEESENEAILVSERFAYRKILESITGNLERDAALLSRELSRRLGDKPGGLSTRKSKMFP